MAKQQLNAVQWLRNKIEIDLDLYFYADAIEKEKAIYFAILVFEKLNKFPGIDKIDIKENKYLVENIYKEAFYQIQ